MRLSHMLLNLLPFLLPSAVAYTTLSDETLKNIPGPGSDFDIHNGAILAPILQPRVPGTPGSIAVQHHLVDFFQNNLPQWTIEFQNSTSKAPPKDGPERPFVNIIATRDPPWTQPGDVGRLALVAHYDSKFTPTGFIGATDSAAPCAMLLHAARSLDAALTKKWAAMEAEGAGAEGFGSIEEQQGIQILLLDGEEAFVVWSNDDSLYGARALAETWEQTPHSALSTYRNPIDAISLFLLLDLLGAKDPRVPSYFKTTHWAYKAMAEVETRLRSLHQFKSSPNHPSKRSISTKNSKARGAARQEPLFLHEGKKQENDRWIGGFVGDDHLPFMTRGVEVLHVIPSPFPKVWHEITDDGEHLDMDTVEDWTKLVTAFAAEWMDLEGFFETPGGQQGDDAKVKREDVISKTEL